MGARVWITFPFVPFKPIPVRPLSVRSLASSNRCNSFQTVQQRSIEQVFCIGVHDLLNNLPSARWTLRIDHTRKQSYRCPLLCAPPMKHTKTIHQTNR